VGDPAAAIAIKTAPKMRVRISLSLMVLDKPKDKTALFQEGFVI
jgi:hypothetical protein